MPPLPSVPNVLVIQLKFTVGNANVLSRVHVRNASASPSRDDLNAYAANIDAAIGTRLIALFSVQVKTVEVMVTDLTSMSAARGIAPGRQVGTRPGLPNGAAVAALINFRVARRYRGGKPRVYVPFFVSSDLTPGLRWSDGAFAEGTASWGAFMSGVLTCTPPALRVVEQVNVSYYEGFEVVPDLRTGRSRNVPQLRPGWTCDRQGHRVFAQPEARQSKASEPARSQARGSEALAPSSDRAIACRPHVDCATSSLTSRWRTEDPQAQARLA